MIVKYEIPVYQISWLNYAEGGLIETYYEPESIEELKNIVRSLYREGKSFDIVGHTSNIYFLPDYSTDILISTRRIKNFVINEDSITADCGVGVRWLACQMVDEGVSGFEGLIDLPGTVAAAVYGNASCYDCSINSLLISFEVLRQNGEIETLYPADLKLSRRSSSFKRGEQKGIILSVKLRKEYGSKEEIRLKASQNHQKRKTTQPPAQNNLGSIYRDSEGWSPYGKVLKNFVALYDLFCRVTHIRKNGVDKKSVLLRLIGATDLKPYIYSWNRFIWKDADAHRLFWKFHHKHQKLFKNSDFEIEIKGKI